MKLKLIFKLEKWFRAGQHKVRPATGLENSVLVSFDASNFFTRT